MKNFDLNIENVLFLNWTVYMYLEGGGGGQIQITNTCNRKLISKLLCLSAD